MYFSDFKATNVTVIIEPTRGPRSVAPVVDSKTLPVASDAFPSPDPGRRWLVSKHFDLAILAAPAALSVASLGLASIVGPGERLLPLWAFLILIVAFDVSHVWATAYLTYFDRDVVRRRPLLLWLPIPVFGLIAFRLHLHSPDLYWTLLAYVAIYHFIAQQWGFVALYKARAKERSRFDYYLDKWTLWVGALGPVLLWHASPGRQFDWFHAGESFIATINPTLKPDVQLAMWVVGGTYVARQIQVALTTGRVNIGKNLWIASAWVSWSVGISWASHPLVSAAFLNLFHGIPFLALVWHRCNRRWEGKAQRGKSRLAWLSQRKNWALFYAAVVAIALVEETLWDGVVWRVYIPKLLDLPDLNLQAWALSFWVAVLSIPQIIHYFLDAWIWKLDGSNPDLKQALGV